MRSRPSRLAAVVAGSILVLLLVGCGTSQRNLPSSASLSGVTPGTPTTSTPASTSTTSTTFIQQAADQAHIANLLVGAANLPAGFSPTPDTQVGDAISLCGQQVSPVAGAAATAAVALHRNGTQEQVVERLATLGTIPAASAIVATVRQAAGACHSFDTTTGGLTVTMLVTPIHPPAIGEEVAGVQLATSARFVDVVVVRSGQVDALVILTEVGNPVPNATMNAVVTAAGTKLAVGLGG